MITPASTVGAYGLVINQETAFSDKKGRFKERIKKQQLEMLKNYVPLLKQFLEPGEIILLVMRGCSPMTTMEQVTSGSMIYYIKRCTLVVTDRRILHFPSMRDFSPRPSIAQIRYGDVEEIKPSVFLGRFTVKYRSAVRETFLRVKQAAKLKSILPTLTSAGHKPTSIGVRQHLCPKCSAVLTPGVYSCFSCKLEFKNEQRARNISILYPGGGYFYTDHPFVGTVNAIIETGLIAMVVLGFLNMRSGAPDPADGWFQVMFFGSMILLEKLYSMYHAKHYVKEYLPVEKEIRPLKRTT